MNRARNGEAGSPIQQFLQELYGRFAGVDAGQVADYIPELAKADPRWFGIAIATIDGHVYEVGDSRQPFTIQSISKPLVYGVALEDQGRERVMEHIGVEPTGDAFNSISLEPGTGRPLNPMINAGAIAATSLVGGATPDDRLARVLGGVSAYAGRELTIDERVFESERDTGHRNRAIGHMLRNYGILRDDPDDALELYFKQCSILADCRDLALIAATLANGGVHPATGRRALSPAYVELVLSVMTTCGVYDFAGEWVWRVGMAAKSGVGGGIMAVLPGQLGVGVFSPLLDARGNSVRGVKVCESLSSGLQLHFMHPPRPSASVLRSRYTLATVRSKRRRLPSETALLDAHGAQVLVLELQGDLRFTAAERIVREISESSAAHGIVLLDFKRVTRLDPSTIRMLSELARGGAQGGPQIVLTRVRDTELLEAVAPLCAAEEVACVRDELDLGLEWCEQRLLAAGGSAHALPGIEDLAQHQLCAGLSRSDVAVLESMVQAQRFAAGERIVCRGDAADRLYFLMRGEVSVVVPLHDGGHRRLSTLSPGMGFGEAALLDAPVRTADVRCDTEVECWSLSVQHFAALERVRPSLMIGVLRNLLRMASETAGRLTSEVAALES